jgi:ribosomal subunit interface protein
MALGNGLGHLPSVAQRAARGLTFVKGPARGARGRRAAPRLDGLICIKPAAAEQSHDAAMQIPLQITLHGIEHSDALYNAIREKAEKLELYYDRIISCRVVLELAGLHKRHGKQFTARIDIKVPGGEIAITHEHDEDLQIALRDAFDAARRKLEDYARGQRGDVKHHVPEP